MKAGLARRTRWFFCLALPTAALFVLAGVYPRFPGDEPFAQWLQGLRTPWLDQAVLAVSKLGDAWVALSLVGAAVLLLLLFRRRADALMTAVSLVPIAVGNLLKMAVGRARPEQAMAGTEVTGLAFPSGHALFALLFAAILIVLAEELIQTSWVRRGAQAVLAALALAIGLSRVYLGAHWPSDVIGGYLFGGASMVLLLAFRDVLRSRGWQQQPGDGNGWNRRTSAKE